MKTDNNFKLFAFWNDNEISSLTFIPDLIQTIKVTEKKSSERKLVKKKIINSTTIHDL